MQTKSKLYDSIQYLKKIGPKRAIAFEKIGIHTVYDLLHFFPSRYLDRTNVLNTSSALNYMLKGYDGEITIIGKVVNKEIIRYTSKQILKIQFKDSKGFFDCTWFQGIKYIQDKFNEGEFYAISAKPVLTKYGNLQFTHPDFDRITDEESSDFLNTGKIIPFYRLSKELKSVNLGDISLRNLIKFCVENYSNYLEEPLPQDIVKKNKLIDYKTCIKNIHFPESSVELQKSIYRMKFEELFYFEILVALKKYAFKNNYEITPLKIKTNLIKVLLEKLPYELTKAQLKVLHEIRTDLESKKTMSRLIQGDVGSGKTIVALIAMLIAIDNDFQAVIMAPTEILAQQHFINISKLLNPHFNIEIVLLTGGAINKKKKLTIEKIKNNKSLIAIGTHALLEDTIEFNNLGLIVIDEQHRFGVAQRSRLIEKGLITNTIVMSATPIPRTLSYALYGDLDISVIDELPANRKPINTSVRGDSKLPAIYKFIKEKISEGYQSYIIYPLVEESEKLELKSAEEFYYNLSTTYFADNNIGLLHGRMTSDEKDLVMQRFKDKELDILISTTVIEVGIDIPDANIMVINDAHRFGISQLHQLRGRVGRGSQQAYCILVTKDYLASKIDKFSFNFEYFSSTEIEKYKALIKLNALANTNSGFELAEIDLKLRGPGNLFGTEQTGIPAFKFVDLTEDQDILLLAKENAFSLIEKDPKLLLPEYLKLKNYIINNYNDELKYCNIA